jgi:nitric oxide reductase subunit B
MEVLRWLRVPGDTLFAIGAIALAWFVAGQTIGSARRSRPSETGKPEAAALAQAAR